MTTVVLVIHLMIAIALVGVVLLQRSEGGALGIGSGGGLVTGRGAANILTRTTAVLALMFFITSITLTVLSRNSSESESIFDSEVPAQSAPADAPVLPPPPPATPDVPAAQ